MVTRAQLDRIATRIEALAPKSDRVVYVWRNRGETAEEVLERHYLTSPADRFAGQTYILSWLDRTFYFGNAQVLNPTHLLFIGDGQ